MVLWKTLYSICTGWSYLSSKIKSHEPQESQSKISVNVHCKCAKSSMLLLLSKKAICINTKVFTRKTAFGTKGAALSASSSTAAFCNVHLSQCFNTSSGWLSGRFSTTSVGNVPALEIKRFSFTFPCTLLTWWLCTRSLLFYLVLPV